MKLHTLKGHIQTIFLVEYDHGLMLLDGCCRADVPTIESFITQELGRPFDDLKLVVVTHMHPDHAGAAHKLRSLTGCKIATGVAQGHWYKGLGGLVMWFTDVVLASWVAKRIGKEKRSLWYSPFLKHDITLHDGDTLPGFDEWKTITTHGHTDRDISLYHEASHRIYVADLIVKVKDKFLPPFPVFHPNRYRSSIEKLRALSPDILMLAHGGELNVTKEHPYFDVYTPQRPRTIWRAIKFRFGRMIQRA